LRLATEEKQASGARGGDADSAVSDKLQPAAGESGKKTSPIVLQSNPIRQGLPHSQGNISLISWIKAAAAS
jgi:hypothetical protein